MNGEILCLEQITVIQIEKEHVEIATYSHCNILRTSKPPYTIDQRSY